ncbi:MAG: T9SS type A sorting domain-containing protein [Bacteroidota bacterium]|nr:T9SS type A sorting domain-containing protein [Bacteroidota bacterium]
MRYVYLLFYLLIPFCISAQNVVNTVKIDNPVKIETPKWSDRDVRLINNEPYANIDGVQRQNGDIYIGIADSVLNNWCKYYLLKSTDLGQTWNQHNIGITAKISKCRLICSSADSVYSFYLQNDSVYCWNVNTMNTLKVPSTYKVIDFDVARGQNNSLHVFYYSGDAVYRVTTTDGGTSWSTVGAVSIPSGYPSVNANKQGDTVFCTYYDNFTAYNYKAPLYTICYTCNSIGELAPSNSRGYITSSSDTLTYKSELKSACVKGKQFVLYTSGLHGSISIMGSLSTNSGSSFTQMTIANSPKDEYWMDIKPFNDDNGFDIVYYADSLQAGNPNSNTDYLQYFFTVNGASFQGNKKLTSHIPFWSPNNYKPKIIELSNEDCAILWVGLDSAFNKGVYWNRFGAPTAVNDQSINAKDYSLAQNYPNPFNPSTTITFSTPKESKVSLKVYDALGREVAVLVNDVKSAGQYHINFDGKNLSSGVYFYKLAIDGFVQTKKMMLMK